MGSYHFDGTDDHIVFADNDAFDIPDNATDWTLLTTFKMVENSGTWNYFLWKGDNAGSNFLTVYMRGDSASSPGQFTFFAEDSGSDQLFRRTDAIPWEPGNDTDWHRCICVYTASDDTMRMYREEDPSTVQGTVTNTAFDGVANAEDVWFGEESNSNSDLNGYLGDFAFWSGTAASGQMLADLCAWMTPGNYSTNRVWWVQFEQSGAEEVDIPLSPTITGATFDSTESPPSWTTASYTFGHRMAG